MLGIILLGAPGAGKGTQAQFITSSLNIPQISTGDMLRRAIAEGSDLGVKARAFTESGKLVPDEVVIGLVKERIQLPDCKNGYLFDGFPRTIAQADSLKHSGVKIDYVIEIDVPEDVIIKRLSGRRVHVASGRTYHVDLQPPRIANVDDITNEPLIQRDDDKEETIRNRLTVYKTQTTPLIEYYKQYKEVHYITIDGTQDVEVVKAKILENLK